MDTTMHAVRGHRRGGPEVLAYEEAPRPVPGDGEVLVEVRSAAITPGELTWDATWTDSLQPGGRPRLPAIPAKEVAGVLAEGPGAGDEVFGLIPFTMDGAAAEFTVVPAGVLAPKPAGLGFEEAAALALAGLTAWQGLVRHGGLRKGGRVLVHGAAGGVGSLAVQVAAALDAEVIGTAGPDSLDFVRELGAARVVDYRNERFEDLVEDVDVVLDTVGGEVQQRSWQVLRDSGVLVSVVSPPAAPGQGGPRGTFFVVEPDQDGLVELSRLVEAGRLTVPVDQVVPLSGTAAAYAALDRRGRRGKIVLRVS
ncbi:NADP-dependent oxidoreductase [Streptomyces cocklensis]|uniref:NADPH:quinone reductase n=1 Tax=Actinacidiphila cocklensis TaxID=887465 RepID=A0A9W4GU71_9ACTN|nr:NADP-dependent oxidoreductase [Actinacidiphila cocklensis]MDD1062323.1 NADP-dependent oxidoreductase [Actinacidiphila cocklensis]CAG6395420.1 NADPH:quinone reductase [Actinacidiphila cocklensis]